MALDATVGGVNANSYCTVGEASAYHDTILYADVWTAATPTNREKALIWATRLLDEGVDWDGFKVTVDQRLRWPRSGAYDPDSNIIPSDIIPEWLKNATAEMARYLLTENRTEERGFGIERVKAGPVEVTFDKGDVKPFFPPSVVSLIQGYGTIGSAGEGVNVPLERV